MHKYSVIEKYEDATNNSYTNVNEPPNKLNSTSVIRNDSLFVTIIHNPFLQLLKKRTYKKLITPGLIEPFEIINNCQALVPYVPNTINEVLLGRSELFIPPQIITPASTPNVLVNAR